MHPRVAEVLKFLLLRRALLPLLGRLCVKTHPPVCAFQRVVERKTNLFCVALRRLFAALRVIACEFPFTFNEMGLTVDLIPLRTAPVVVFEELLPLAGHNYKDF